MLNICAIERFYRDVLLGERLDVLQSEIAAMSAQLRPDEQLECEHLQRAERYLRMAGYELREAKAEARTQCQEALLDAQMKASLELVGESPERMRRDADRCREIGEGH